MDSSRDIIIRNEDTAAVRSSIALLQERFRELQRAKVMRQQKEALMTRVLPPSQTNYYYQAASQLWPALQLHKRKRDEEEYYIHTSDMTDMSRRRKSTMNENYYPPLINLWPNVDASSSSAETCSSYKLNNSDSYQSDYDVDTSLHL